MSEPDEEERRPVNEPDDEERRRERFMTHWKAATLPAEGAWAEKRRLASAMRRVIERLVTSDAPEDELSLAADRLEQYADHLATHPRSRRYLGFAEAANAGDLGAFFDASPVIGLANPLAPPLRLSAEEDGRFTGRVRFGAAYEGPPGCVHGGWVAAGFDEFLGYVQSASGMPGMTGTLTIRYRSPTPLHTDLLFEAETGRAEGRKRFCEGRLYAGERLCAEAEGVFIAIDGSRFAELLEQREREAGGTPDAAE